MKRTLIVIGAATAQIGLLAPIAFEGNSDAQARSFRSDDRIAKPPVTKKGKPGAPSGQVPANVVPVDPQVVRRAIYQIAAAWSGQGLGQYLDREKFYDKRRLLDVITRDVPRNAKIRVLSIGGINTLSQRQERRSDGIYVTSIVNASVSLQVEFNHPQSGFQRLQGRNEWTLQVVEKKALAGSRPPKGPGSNLPRPSLPAN